MAFPLQGLPFPLFGLRLSGEQDLRPQRLDLRQIRDPGVELAAIGAAYAGDPIEAHRKVAFDQGRGETLADGQPRDILPRFGQKVGFIQKVAGGKRMAVREIGRQARDIVRRQFQHTAPLTAAHVAEAIHYRRGLTI